MPRSPDGTHVTGPADPFWACPRCRAGWAPIPRGADAHTCGGCGAEYPVIHGIPDLYVPDADAGEVIEVTDAVRGFYEEHPFPHYRPDDDLGSLLTRGRANGFTRSLDEEIPPGARVVELGCGTGQLSLFLGIASREVIGLDLTRASLEVAESMRLKAGIEGVRLTRGNLFRPPIHPRSADVVISNGVLHHTGDARRGFGVAAGLVRPGGYLMVGLYNRYGRFLLPTLRARHRKESGDRGVAWYRDQHEHPHETRHTVDEVLRWVQEEGLEFISASPPITPGAQPAQLLTPRPAGGAIEHLAVQLSWLNRAADGGLWVTIARRPPG